VCEAGLTGSDTPDSTSVSDLSAVSFIPAAGTPFVPSFVVVDWKKNTGELILRLTGSTTCSAPTATGVNLCIKAGSTYVFEFGLLNGKVAQAPPVVKISVLYGSTARKNTAVQTMKPPWDKRYAALALLSKDTFLDMYNIGQVVAQQGKVNALCVTLKPNKDLTTIVSGGGSGFVAFTIKGLTGFQTDDQDLAIRTATTVAGVSAGTTAVTTTTVTIGNLFCKTEVHPTSHPPHPTPHTPHPTPNTVHPQPQPQHRTLHPAR